MSPVAVVRKFWSPALFRELPDGRIVWIHRMLYTSALLIGPDTCGGYEDRWCYPTLAEAEAVLHSWNPEIESEPSGWVRHPASGRRRPEGDASRQYINR